MTNPKSAGNRVRRIPKNHFYSVNGENQQSNHESKPLEIKRKEEVDNLSVWILRTSEGEKDLRDGFEEGRGRGGKLKKCGRKNVGT